MPSGKVHKNSFKKHKIFERMSCTSLLVLSIRVFLGNIYFKRYCMQMRCLQKKPLLNSENRCLKKRHR